MNLDRCVCPKVSWEHWVKVPKLVRGCLEITLKVVYLVPNQLPRPWLTIVPSLMSTGKKITFAGWSQVDVLIYKCLVHVEESTLFRRASQVGCSFGGWYRPGRNITKYERCTFLAAFQEEGAVFINKGTKISSRKNRLMWNHIDSRVSSVPWYLKVQGIGLRMCEETVDISVEPPEDLKPTLPVVRSITTSVSTSMLLSVVDWLPARAPWLSWRGWGL